MPAPRRRGVYEKVEYVVVERDGARAVRQLGVEAREPMTTVDRIIQRLGTGQQETKRTDADYDTDDEDDYDHPKPAATTNLAKPSASPVRLITVTSAKSQVTATALADRNPTETIVVSLSPPPKPPHSDRDGKISQTTEHLLIAAGSIGATIIVVMIILALYTMRKRGLTFKDVMQQGKNHIRRKPVPPPKYGMDNKQTYGNNYAYARANVVQPQPATTNSRKGSLSSQAPLQPLARSDSFGQQGLERNGSVNRSFFDGNIARSNSHKRDISATPSSLVLPIQVVRQSASSHNTRSLDNDEAQLQYTDAQQQRVTPPTPPTFRQFLSNRPSISQRPGFGGGAMASRFSWTNSNAPQTPHDPSRDTVAQPIGRDSFMTQRSSIPRFRTVDSWVNQQSNRIEEQRLKQQFRMTQSSTASDDVDEVPEIPVVPKTFKEGNGLAGKAIKHERHDTTTSVQTAPIFKAHPGTEVRFSVRSTVPSEVLDMGRHNAAL